MLIDRTRIVESEQGNLNYIGEATMNQIRCATFAKVTKVDRSKKVLNCQPLVKEKIRANNGDGYVYVSLPEFLNVPYFTGGSTPQKGDFCVCIHLDRSIKGILTQDSDDVIQVNCDNNRHNISDCVAIVGFLK